MADLGKKGKEAWLEFLPPWPWVRSLPWFNLAAAILCAFSASNIFFWLNDWKLSEKIPEIAHPVLRFVFPVLAIGFAVRAVQRTIPRVRQLLDGEFAREEDLAVMGEALLLRERGRTQEAYELLESEVGRHPTDLELILTYWEVALVCKQREPALVKLVCACQALLSAGKQDAALEVWCEMARVVADIPAPVRVLVKMAEMLLACGQGQLAEPPLRRCVSGETNGLSPGLALRVVDLARESFPEVAALAARRALRAEELDEAKRDRLVHLLKSLESAQEEPPQERALADRKEAVDSVEEPKWQRAAAIAIDLDDDDYTPVSKESATPVPEVQREGLEYNPEEIAAMEAEIPEDDQFASPEIGLGVGLAEPGAETGLTDGLGVTSGPPSQFGSEHPTRTLSVGATELMSRDPLTGVPITSASEPLEGLGKVFGDLDEAEVSFEEAPPVPRFQGIKIVQAKLKGLSGKGLVVHLADGRDGTFPFSKVRAVALAGIEELASEKLEAVVDLVMNWDAEDAKVLSVIRLHWKGIDRDTLGESVSAAPEFLTRVVRPLLQHSNATLLPPGSDREDLNITTFPDLKTYYRLVLCIDA